MSLLHFWDVRSYLPWLIFVSFDSEISVMLSVCSVVSERSTALASAVVTRSTALCRHDLLQCAGMIYCTMQA